MERPGMIQQGILEVQFDLPKKNPYFYSKFLRVQLIRFIISTYALVQRFRRCVNVHNKNSIDYLSDYPDGSERAE